MADKDEPNQVSLQIPISLLRKSTGFALDMGGSVLKMVYLDKKDWDGKDMDKCTDTMGTVHLMSFPVTKLDEALTFMKDNFYIRRTEGEALPAVYTSGVGLQRHGRKMEDLLGVRVENVMETDCFIKAAQYCLRHIPESTLAGTPPTEGIRKGVERGRVIVNFPRRTGATAAPVRGPWEHTDTLGAYVESALEEKPSDEPIGDRIKYPILLGMLGSAFAFMKVEEDGSYSMSGMTPIGGRTFLSLGGLLTGAKDYEELMALAMKGNQRELNVYFRDLVSSAGKEDGYTSASAMDLFVYAFGKGIGKRVDDFSREDMASSIHHLVAHNCINTAIMMLEATGCSDVFMAGSFGHHPLTRDVFAEEFLMLSTKKSAFERKLFLPKMHLLSVGGHLGALGALLHGCGL